MRRAPSPSRASPADDIEADDGFADFRNGIRAIAELRHEWAGIPMPLDDQRLVVEPSFPNAAALAAINSLQEEPLPEGVRYINSWYCPRVKGEVYVWEEEGKRRCAVIPHKLIDHDLQTLGASVAWGLEQETRAMELLATLVNSRQFKQYALTGMFLETSKRSRVTYLFRRLKPTVALDAREDGKKNVRILCALCAHPIAYYHDSWAGAMTPTDDVIAHLMMMRGDEAMFWRRSSQHSALRPEAGI